MKNLFLLLACMGWAICSYGQPGNGQTVTFTGSVSNEETGEWLEGAKVVVPEKQLGTLVDAEGNYSIAVPFEGNEELSLVVTFLGYDSLRVVVSAQTKPKLNLKLTERGVDTRQVIVITGSRVAENVMESPVAIQKMSVGEIRSAPSGDFYQSLGNFAGVDITTSSMGFKTVNTRGFNTTSPVRSVQFIDGMDNQAPGLNFPVGNLVGASDLDLQSVELISGPASALYGPNAFQGVISMTTKDPFLTEGLSVQVRGATRAQIDAQARYAKVLGAKKRFAFKVYASAFRGNDWPAQDTGANRYGDIETTQNLSAIVQQQQYNEELSQEDRDRWIALNNYLDFNPVAYPGSLDIRTPGYMEEELADYTAKSLKFGTGLHYKLRDSLRLSYDYKFGSGTAVYQGTNRYSINNILLQQHKVELQGKRLLVRAYTTLENAGDSYDVVFTGINISKAGVGEYVRQYLTQYFGTLDTLTNGFDWDATPQMVDSAHSAASLAAADAWYRPGSPVFDSLFHAITDDPDLQTGSKFVDRSSLQHVEAQYNFDVPWFDLIAGGNVRRYNPQSYGTIFRDTLLNPGDTLANGQNDPDAAYADISQYEFGAYAQLTKRLLDDRLKLTGSIRFDKNQNFEPQLSPRLSAVYSYRAHNFRVSAQSAFRSPTLQNQYILLDLGPIKLAGNLDGWSNLYTWESVQNFQNHYDSTFAIDPSLLETTVLNPLKPEQIKSLEFGYRSIVAEKLFVDFTAYYSIYSNFIGDVRVVNPLHGAQAGQESGENALLTNTSSNQTYQLYQIPVNASQDVTSYGATLGLAYYFGKGISASANYTYAVLDTAGVTDPIIPGFNTPKHKVNLGLTGRRVWKGLGFAANFKWVDGFYWQSPFGEGPVPSYHLLDAQVSYEVAAWKSTFRVGGSNLLNNRHIEAYGSPMIGVVGYVGWGLEL